MAHEFNKFIIREYSCEFVAKCFFLFKTTIMLQKLIATHNS